MCAGRDVLFQALDTSATLEHLTLVGENSLEDATLLHFPLLDVLAVLEHSPPSNLQYTSVLLRGMGVASLLCFSLAKASPLGPFNYN